MIVIQRDNRTVYLDDADSDLADLTWRLINYRRGGLYLIRTITINSKRHHSALHRVVMSRVLSRELSHNEIVDHKDGNSLNNTRENLRLATSSQNNFNTPIPRHNTTGYKGVSRTPDGKFVAKIQVNKKSIHLGRFSSPELAHEAYKTAALKYAGEFARFS